MNTLSIHGATAVKVAQRETRTREDGGTYTVMDLRIETENGAFEVTCFAKGKHLPLNVDILPCSTDSHRRII